MLTLWNTIWRHLVLFLLRWWSLYEPQVNNCQVLTELVQCEEICWFFPVNKTFKLANEIKKFRQKTWAFNKHGVTVGTRGRVKWHVQLLEMNCNPIWLPASYQIGTTWWTIRLPLYIGWLRVYQTRMQSGNQRDGDNGFSWLLGIWLRPCHTQKAGVSLLLSDQAA